MTAWYNDEEGLEEMTGDQIETLSTAVEEKLTAIVRLAEEFHRQQDLIGMTACGISMTNPAAFPGDSGPKTEGGQTGTAERIQALLERAELVRYREGWKNPGPAGAGQATAVQTAARAIEALSDARAVAALTTMTANRDLEPSLRWAAYGAAQGIAEGAEIPENLEAAQDHPGWGPAPKTLKTVLGEMRAFRQQAGSWKTALENAARQLCREHGIDEPSPGMIERPGIIREMTSARDPEKEHQLTIDLGADDEWYVDGVMFKHEGKTYIKAIGEPFPRGFPGTAAAEIAEEYLSRCNRPDRKPQRAEWNVHRQTGLNALRLAQLELHCLSPEDAAGFIEKTILVLPEGSEMSGQVMRIITGRDNRAQDLLLEGKLQTVPMTGPNGANRVIKAARRAGLRQTELWELARTMGLNPDRYGIRRPTLAPEAMDQIAQAARETGIPENLIAMVREETAMRQEKG